MPHVVVGGWDVQGGFCMHVSGTPAGMAEELGAGWAFPSFRMWLLGLSYGLKISGQLDFLPELASKDDR